MYQSIMLCRIGLVPNSNTNKLKRQYFIFCENIFVIFFVINIFNIHTVQNQLLYVLPLLLFLDGESVHEFDFPALALLASSSGMQSYLCLFKPFEKDPTHKKSSFRIDRLEPCPYKKSWFRISRLEPQDLHFSDEQIGRRLFAPHSFLSSRVKESIILWENQSTHDMKYYSTLSQISIKVREREYVSAALTSSSLRDCMQQQHTAVSNMCRIHQFFNLSRSYF